MFPSDCRFCNTVLATLSRLPVCPACIESIQPILLPRCNRCGDLLGRAEADFGDARCRECEAEEPAYARAVNFGAYNGALRQMVHLLKYERVRPAAQLLGKLAAAACLHLEGDIDVEELVMIPVPAHKSRLRARGFNQAELIAKAAQRGIEESIGRRLTLDVTTLLRTRFAESQVALTAEARRQQIRGAFKVTARERIKGREVLLVDDVMTTGATAAECARELRHAGAARVWVVTPARALGRVAQESLDRPTQLEPAAERRVSFGTATSAGSSFGTSAHSFLPGVAESVRVPHIRPEDGTMWATHGIPLQDGEQRAGLRPTRHGLI